jgi:hypothetical protein
MMQPIEDEIETCCFGFFPSKAWTLDEIEQAMDNNDQYIKFRVEEEYHKFFKPEPALFYSSSYSLMQDHFLVKKVSANNTCAIVLIYKEYDGSRLLVDGTVVIDECKFKVSEFIVSKKMELIENGDTSYEHVPTCVLKFES